MPLVYLAGLEHNLDFPASLIPLGKQRRNEKLCFYYYVRYQDSFTAASKGTWRNGPTHYPTSLRPLFISSGFQPAPFCSHGHVHV